MSEPITDAKICGMGHSMKRKTGDFAVAAAAVQITLGKNGAIESARIGLTNAGLTPVEAVDAARYLVGKQPDDKTIMEAAKMAAAKSSPSADRKGSIEYKKEMARVLTARALKKAVQRAGAN